MLVRHAVLLTAPTVDPRLPRSAQFLCNVSPFRINTYKTVSKQATLSTFRINTYEKQAGWGRGPAIAKQLFHSSASRNELVCFQALAHSFARRKNQLFYFQALPHPLPKTPGVGGILPILVHPGVRGELSSRLLSLVTRHSSLFSSLPLFHGSRNTDHESRPLLHCFTHGSPTPRPTLSRRSPLARRDCACDSRLAALHCAPRKRPALLDRNWFRTR